jgi:signal transduction histidine kinase
MTRLIRSRRWGVVDRLDRTLIATGIALLAVTALMLGTPGVEGHFVAPALDLVLDTMATVVTGSIAVLAWIRYREEANHIAVFEAAAFLSLAIANGVAVAVALANGVGRDVGIEATGQAQLYVFTAARITATAILVIGGTRALSGRRVEHPQALVLASSGLLIAFVGVVLNAGSALPPLIGGESLGRVDETALNVFATPFGVLVQIIGATLTLEAAAVCRRLWRRRGGLGEAHLALGLVLASFAQLHAALFPSIHPAQVASGDFLWLAFCVVLLLGIEAEARVTLRKLRVASETTDRLRVAEIDRAALEERARLARELHDGLAQDLWLAKLKAGRLSALVTLEEGGMALCAELESAIDAGLADARQAVMALRVSAQGSDAPLADLLGRYIDDFGDRFGLRVEFACPAGFPQLDHRAEAELLRIAQEALNNVRRHADATVVRVSLDRTPEGVVLSIRDNGRGFDPAALVDGGYGLSSMKERATIINALLTITSREQGGTDVTVSAPGIALPGPASAAG